MSYLLLILFQIGSSFLRYGSFKASFLRYGSFKELEHDQEIYPLIDSSPPVEQWSQYSRIPLAASGPKGIRPQFLDPALTGAPFENFC